MKNKIGIALFILLLLAAVSVKLSMTAAIACLIVAVLLSRRSRSRNTMTGAALKKKILEQYKLVTYTDTFEVSVESALSKLNIPFTDKAVPGTKRQFRLTVPVTVDITTDLQNMEVRYDAENNAASVTIPEAEIFRVTTDISNIRLEQEIGFIRNLWDGEVTAGEQQAMLVEAENKARAQTLESGYIPFANRRARNLLEGMIKRFGVKYVEVNVR